MKGFSQIGMISSLSFIVFTALTNLIFWLHIDFETQYFLSNLCYYSGRISMLLTFAILLYYFLKKDLILLVIPFVWFIADTLFMTIYYTATDFDAMDYGSMNLISRILNAYANYHDFINLIALGGLLLALNKMDFKSNFIKNFAIAALVSKAVFLSNINLGFYVFASYVLLLLTCFPFFMLFMFFKEEMQRKGGSGNKETDIIDGGI